MKRFIIIFCLILFIFSGTYFLIQPVYDSINFPENMYVTYADVNSANESGKYSFIKFSLPENVQVGNEAVSSTTMDIKLFGWLPIKKVKVKLLNDIDVYIGGNTVGFHLTSNGVVVVGSNPIFTQNGQNEPIKSCALQNGDCIQKINNVEINNIADIDKILNSSTNPEIAELEVVRNNELINFTIKPALDLFTKRYRLGLWVQNSTSGVGTLTYVKKSDYRFGAVGHPIAKIEGSTEETNGGVYLCNYLGIKKGTKENPGEIQTSIKLSDNQIGTADTNCEYGVYGNLNNLNGLDMTKETSLGGRMSVKLGNAKIYCDLDGDGVKAYDIKIIKTNHQNQASEKSIMLRVTDKALLEKTGGIIQGMSGSPIVQDGKLVGAVTHVFLNDPTKAFGVYIDWMIDN